MHGSGHQETWQRFGIRRIEDLGNAVLGAELEAVQMTGPPIRGSLAFTAHDGIVFSSGLLTGNVLLRGVPAADAATLLFVLTAGRGSWLQLRPVADGTIRRVLPGEAIEAYLTAGTLYLAATAAPDRLQAFARPDGAAAAATRNDLASVCHAATDLHADRSERRSATVGTQGLEAMLRQGAPHPPAGNTAPPAGPALIVRAARDYLRGHLAEPMTTATLARAIEVAPRSLYRAFATMLGDTPQGHVRRLRLHCVRRLLLAAEEPASTVIAAARRLGLERDMGRLSGRYRTLFGEPPSETLARRNARLAEGAPM